MITTSSAWTRSTTAPHHTVGLSSFFFFLGGGGIVLFKKNHKQIVQIGDAIFCTRIQDKEKDLCYDNCH